MRVVAAAEAAQQPAAVTIAFTGELIGTLEPCDCSEGQLGGLPRRAGLLKKWADEGRALLRIDGGDNITAPGRQAELKHAAIVASLDAMQYDVAVLGEGELRLPREKLAALWSKKKFPVVASNVRPTQGEVRFEPYVVKEIGRGAAKVRVGVLGLINEDLLKRVPDAGTWLAVEPALDALARLLPEVRAKSDVVVCVYHLRLFQVETVLPKLSGVDIVLACDTSIQPLKDFLDRAAPPLLVSPGIEGKHVARVGVFAKDGAGFRFEPAYEPLVEAIPEAPSVVQILRKYDEDVAKAGLLAEVKREKPERGGTFVGSDACARCHKEEYEVWKASGHAKAHRTLVKDGRDQDPECVACHVVGFRYVAGFESLEKTPNLAAVGCESCHGVGSDHAANPDKGYEASGRTTCLTCHDPAHSTGFDHDTFWPKIQH